MMLSDEERQEIEKRRAELVELYRRVKAQMIASEYAYWSAEGLDDSDGKLKASLPGMNELRHAFDHLMRVDCVILLNDETGPTKSKMGPFLYCRTNLDKAIGHVYRAGYDAFEIIVVSLVEEIERMIDSVSRMTLVAVIPAYVDEVAAPIGRALATCGRARSNKDVEAEGTGGVFF